MRAGKEGFVLRCLVPVFERNAGTEKELESRTGGVDGRSALPADTVDLLQAYCSSKALPKHTVFLERKSTFIYGTHVPTTKTQK
jgi:hypothetical protein